MKSLLRSFTRRSSRLGLLSDVAMVAGAAMKVMRRSGGSTASGVTGVGGGARSIAPAQWLLVAGAAVRLLRRIRAVRRRRRVEAAATAPADG